MVREVNAGLWPIRYVLLSGTRRKILGHSAPAPVVSHRRRIIAPSEQIAIWYFPYVQFQSSNNGIIFAVPFSARITNAQYPTPKTPVGGPKKSFLGCGTAIPGTIQCEV